MNNRIKDLAVQAGLYFQPQGLDYFPKNLSAEESEVVYEKFAQLIIQDCMMLGENFHNRWQNCSAAERIAEYFGIDY